MRLYFRKIVINCPETVREKGPLLIACNHPNSFLDAVVLDLLFARPIHALARGDAFVNPFISSLLRTLRILPVYRSSEGLDQVPGNYTTFAACLELFRKNGLVLMFSEGLCINEWHLRPLKKGTARLAIQSWDEAIPLRVLPVGLNYSSFRGPGGTLVLNFGKLITPGDVMSDASEGVRYQAFNQLLRDQLAQLVVEIRKEDAAGRKRLMGNPVSAARRKALRIPAALGSLLHAPYYRPLRWQAKKWYGGTIHFDSVMMGLLLLTYPVYLALVWLLLFLVTGSWYSLLVFAIMPLVAWARIQLMDQAGR